MWLFKTLVVHSYVYLWHNCIVLANGMPLICFPFNLELLLNNDLVVTHKAMYDITFKKEKKKVMSN